MSPIGPPPLPRRSSNGFRRPKILRSIRRFEVRHDWPMLIIRIIIAAIATGIVAKAVGWL